MSHEHFALPQKYFTSLDVFVEEIKKIFHEEWICVGRLEQISGPGDFIVEDIGGENLIILKDHEGLVRAFYNVCRHRGSRLCQESNGKFSKTIQCPYHAWTYGLDGALLGAPSAGNGSSFSKEAYSLHSAAVHTWEGFIFVSLSERPLPFEEANVGLMNRFAAWQIVSLRTVAHIEYDVAANWKLIAQNYSECYHCSLVHPALVRVAPADSGQNLLIEGAVLGGYMEFSGDHESMSLSGHTCAPPVGSVAGDDLKRAHFYTVFPNLLLSLHPDYVMFHTLWPQGHDRTRVNCAWLFTPETIAKADFDPADAIEFWDKTNREDWRVCELSQSGISSKAYQPGPYSETREALLPAFDKLVLEKLNCGKA
jgi:Rieske 2Fe-2S family protein